MVKLKRLRPKPSTKWGALLTLGAIFFAGCNVVLGLDGTTVIVDEEVGGASGNGDGDGDGDGDMLTEECVLNTDCDQVDENFVCIFSECSTACKGDRDCEDGSRCLLAEDGAACVSAEQAECQETAECPRGSVCFDQKCRIDCSNDNEACQDDQSCTSSGVCKGSDPEHDPIETGAGDKCDDEGALRCVETGSVLRVECKEGVWQSYDSCGDGELCDPDAKTPGSCDEIPADCEGRKANESFCDGRIRKTCGRTLLTVDSEDCPSIQHCSLATGPKCAACLPNTFDCEDTILMECAADLSEFVEKADCADEGKPCSDTAGACTQYACNPGQKRCREGDVLEVCNDERSAFVEDEQCGAGLCNSKDLVCDTCVANAKSCDTQGKQVLCSADGSTETRDDCPVDRPICSAGSCVQCTGKNQCPSSGECSDPVCNANSCGLNPIPANNTCAAGYCDGSGSCRQCLSLSQCPDVGDCYDKTCTGNVCGQKAKSSGACDENGGFLCNGSGSCVECLSSNLNFCPDVGDCYNKTCSGNVCGQSPKSSGTCNENGGTVCDGSGLCVECSGVGQVQCSSGEVCHSNSCEVAEHLFGNSTLGTETKASFSGALVACLLPDLLYDATLLSFGAAGNKSGVSARMVLYEGNNTQPLGAPIAQSGGQNFPLQGGTLVEVVPSSANVILDADKTYWIGIATRDNSAPSADTLLRGTTSAGAKCRVFGQSFDYPFGNGQSGNSYNGFDFNLFARIEDVE